MPDETIDLLAPTGDELGCGSAMALERLYDPVQPPTQTDRTCIQRALQSVVGRRLQRRLLKDRLRVRTAEFE